MLGAKTESKVDIVEEEVKSVGAKVSPWLWIVSLTGFALGLVSRWQIHKMYGSFKNMKKALTK